MTTMALSSFELKPRLVGGKWLLDGPTLGDGYELRDGLSTQGNNAGTVSLQGDFVEFSVPGGLQGTSQASLDSFEFVDGNFDLGDPAPDLSLPPRTSLTVEGWFTPPSDVGTILVSWREFAGFGFGSFGDRAGISIVRLSSGLSARLDYYFANVISASIPETSEPVHLRGVFANGLATLAINGEQAASIEYTGFTAFQPFIVFTARLRSVEANTAKVKLQRLYYTALQRDQFTPPTV
jgi:hypothetical protein